jgi:hypothetical protein
MTREFICAECGTPIWSAIPLTATQPRLCATCISLPGWFEDPELRRILDSTNLVDPAKILGDKP